MSVNFYKEYALTFKELWDLACSSDSVHGLGLILEDKYGTERHYGLEELSGRIGNSGGKQLWFRAVDNTGIGMSDGIVEEEYGDNVWVVELVDTGEVHLKERGGRDG